MELNYLYGKMPKSKKGGKTDKKKIKAIDYAADEFFDPRRSIIYIEHTEECPIFKEKANEFHLYVQTNFPDRPIVLIRNQNGKQLPRIGAFEINFAQSARSPIHLLWTGIDKGPPRCDKFPISYELLLPEVRTIINKIYVDLTAKPKTDSLDMMDDGDEEGLAEGGAADGEYVDLNENTDNEETETNA